MRLAIQYLLINHSLLMVQRVHQQRVPFSRVASYEIQVDNYEMPIPKTMRDEFEFDEALGTYKDAVAVYFMAEGTELLGQSKQPHEPANILEELKRRRVKVIVHSRGFPGYPYFEILIALFLPGWG